MKDLLVVDIDSTLYSFSHAFAHVARRDHGRACSVDPVEWATIVQDFGDPALAIKTFPAAYSHEMIEYNLPYENAMARLTQLSERFRLAYYTDRPLESGEATHAWLERYNFPDGEVHVCSDKRSELMSRRDEIASLIDDRPRTLVWGRYELGLDHVFSLQHGYNRALKDIPGVHIYPSWDELYLSILEYAV